MKKEDSDLLFFISFCIEQDKMHQGLSGSEAMKLFDHYGITEYLTKHYDVLHTQSAQWMMQEIDGIIKQKKK